MVVIFCIADAVVRFIPVLPTFGTDTSGRESTVHEDSVGIVTPRTTKVHLIYIRGKGDGAFVEDSIIKLDSSLDNTIYNYDSIVTDNLEKIAIRNDRKSKILKYLSKKK